MFKMISTALLPLTLYCAKAYSTPIEMNIEIHDISFKTFLTCSEGQPVKFNAYVYKENIEYSFQRVENEVYRRFGTLLVNQNLSQNNLNREGTLLYNQLYLAYGHGHQGDLEVYTARRTKNSTSGEPQEITEIYSTNFSEFAQESLPLNLKIVSGDEKSDVKKQLSKYRKSVVDRFQRWASEEIFDVLELELRRECKTN